MSVLYPEWIRDHGFPGGLVLIDGLSGTGKNMMARIIDSYYCNHNPTFSYELEQMCIAHKQGKLQKDAAIAMLRMHIDKLKYNFEISREINFRRGDLSSVVYSVSKLKYLKNLFFGNTENTLSALEKTRKNICIITHQLLDSTVILDEVLPEELVRIFMIRHPVYLYEHWLRYLPLHGNSARDITVWNKSEKGSVPWFIVNFAEEYDKLTLPNKTSFVVSTLTNLSIEYVRINSVKREFICIDFENFVLRPEKYLKKLDNVFGASVTNRSKILDKEKIPRLNINSSRNLSIYARNGAITKDLIHAHEIDYETKIKKILINLDTHQQKLFIKAVENYNSFFGLWF
jgi:hypothetical protein